MTENAGEMQSVIGALREEIRRIEQKPPPRACFLSSGRPEVDALLPGRGFPRGALSELAGGPASGKTGLVLSALAAAMGEEGLAAFVDGRGELYPPAVLAFGVDLSRLLVVRSPPGVAPGEGESVRNALWAAETLLASGAFEAVAIDVPLELARAHVPSPCNLEGMLRRVRAAAEKGGAVGLWLGSAQGAHVPSAVRLELSAGPAGARVRRAFARGDLGAEGAPRTPWRETSVCRALGTRHAA
jgi:protein ImuA